MQTAVQQPPQHFSVDELTRKFLQLGKTSSETAQLPTVGFHDAIMEIIPILAGLGTKFRFVYKEVLSRLVYLMRAMEVAGPRGSSLQGIIAYEKENSSWQADHSGTMNTLHLTTTLFVLEALMKQLHDNPQIKLSNASWNAYTSTIRYRHPRLVQGMVWIGTKFLPSRQQFLKQINLTHEESFEAMAKLQQALHPVIEACNQMMKENKFTSAELDDILSGPPPPDVSHVVEQSQSPTGTKSQSQKIMNAESQNLDDTQ